MRFFEIRVFVEDGHVVDDETVGRHNHGDNKDRNEDLPNEKISSCVSLSFPKMGQLISAIPLSGDNGTQ